MKIGIVGAGHVGSTAAYSLVLLGTGSELVLVDLHQELAEAQGMDILHATPFSHPVRVRSGSFEDLAKAQIIILAAGISQAPGESRLQLLSRNVRVFAEIIPEIMRFAGDPILVVATNPVDIMTYAAAAISRLPPQRVIGTGTMLDTARFRALLGEVFGISPNSVHAQVLGEHGDSEVLAWNSARISGMDLSEFAHRSGKTLGPSERDAIDSAVRGAAQRIIAGKGATYYGIGAALAQLVRCILHDQRMMLTVSSVAEEVEGIKDVALSLPCSIGVSGIALCLPPPLDDLESRLMQQSASLVRSYISSLGY